MSLEAATFLNDLVPTNPAGGDQKSDGDNHIRMLKSVLQATFPGLAGQAFRSQTKSSGYTPALTDNLSLLNCTATLTLSMTAAATLGNGHLVFVYANGGDVTIDPNGAETVNGAATFVIPNGFMGLVACNGTSFVVGMFPVASGSVWSTGDVKSTMKTVADTGWVMMNDGTIGDASSGGTTRANADTVSLFTLLWNNTANADCPVSGGRGATAAADFAAHKNIALPKALGRALAGAGTGSGLTARALGSAFGEENHALSSGELATHTHGPGSLTTDAQGTHGHNVSLNIDSGGGSGFNAASVTGGTVTGALNVANAQGGAVNVGITDSQGNHGHNVTGGATGPVGSGTAHNTMQPSVFLNFMIKL